ncbi:hypothetical protein, partial [Bacillus pseudomycoides]|uniref:hypothetical protein n=1 Tax=Bacillus pseudomycoides TaxID=64104 RepID=UPI001C3F2583
FATEPFIGASYMPINLRIFTTSKYKKTVFFLYILRKKQPFREVGMYGAPYLLNLINMRGIFNYFLRIEGKKLTQT